MSFEPNLHTWAARLPLPTVLTANPARSAILGVLIIVMGVMWARALGVGPTVGRADVNPRTVSRTTTSPGAGLASSPRPASYDQNAVSRAALGAWLRQTPATAGRNLFSIDLKHYPLQEPLIPPTSDKPQEPTPRREVYWESVAKSLDQEADENRRRQERAEQARRDAARFRLSTTVMRAPPMALIDGRMVREGDAVRPASDDAGGEFTVRRIEPRRVLVERDGLTLELRMSDPTGR